MKTVVMSIFEGGYQPITALSAYTALKAGGHDTRFFDLYVEGTEKLTDLAEADVFALSIPLYDALKAVPDLVGQIKAVRPDARPVGIARPAGKEHRQRQPVGPGQQQQRLEQRVIHRWAL